MPPSVPPRAGVAAIHGVPAGARARGRTACMCSARVLPLPLFSRPPPTFRFRFGALSPSVCRRDWPVVPDSGGDCHRRCADPRAPRCGCPRAVLPRGLLFPRDAVSMIHWLLTHGRLHPRLRAPLSTRCFIVGRFLNSVVHVQAHVVLYVLGVVLPRETASSMKPAPFGEESVRGHENRPSSRSRAPRPQQDGSSTGRGSRLLGRQGAEVVRVLREDARGTGQQQLRAAVGRAWGRRVS